MSQTKYITEVFDEIAKDASKAANYREDFAFKTILKCAFDTEYKFMLPAGDPPYKPAPQPMGMTSANLRNEMRRMYIFTKFSDVKTKLRREQLYVQLLESIHPSEAKLLNAVKDQKLDALYPKVTAEFVKKNFPDVLPEGVVVAEPAKKSKVKSAEKVG